jgi:hypothetical protein
MIAVSQTDRFPSSCVSVVRQMLTERFSKLHRLVLSLKKIFYKVTSGIKQPKGHGVGVVVCVSYTSSQAWLLVHNLAKKIAIVLLLVLIF